MPHAERHPVQIEPASRFTPNAKVTPRLARALNSIQGQRLVQAIEVRVTADLAIQMNHELSEVGSHAVTDYLLLRKRAALQATDPVEADEIRLITETVRLGMAEIVAGVATTYSRRQQ